MEWAWMSVNWLVDEENTLHLHNGILPIHKQKWKTKIMKFAEKVAKTAKCYCEN